MQVIRKSLVTGIKHIEIDSYWLTAIKPPPFVGDTIYVF